MKQTTSSIQDLLHDRRDQLYCSYRRAKQKTSTFRLSLEKRWPSYRCPVAIWMTCSQSWKGFAITICQIPRLLALEFQCKWTPHCRTEAGTPGKSVLAFRNCARQRESTSRNYAPKGGSGRSIFCFFPFGRSALRHCYDNHDGTLLIGLLLTKLG